MRKRLVHIYLVLVVAIVILAVLVPGCSGGGDGNGGDGGGGGGQQCTIEIKATLDGSPWSGTVIYQLTAPGDVYPLHPNYYSLPVTHSNVDCGIWSCAYGSGGPAGASFVSITPSPTQSLSLGNTITFTLNFVTAQPLVLDHFDCYWTGEEMLTGEHVSLEDQFGTYEVTVEESWYFCTPVEKERDGVVTPILDPDHHFTFYEISLNQQIQYWQVNVDNQFGPQYLTAWGPVCLAVPTQKVQPGNHEPPVGLDHFLLYEVEQTQVNEVVGLRDQFTYGEDGQFVVTAPLYFANPVQKTHGDDVTEIQNPEAHLVFYELSGQLFSNPAVQVVNQFGGWTFTQVEGPWLLAVPSQKLSWEQQPQQM